MNRQTPTSAQPGAGQERQIRETSLPAILAHALGQKACFPTSPRTPRLRDWLRNPLREEAKKPAAVTPKWLQPALPRLSPSVWEGAKNGQRYSQPLEVPLHPSCPQPLYKDGDNSGPVRSFVCPDTRIHHPRKMNRANPGGKGEKKNSRQVKYLSQQQQSRSSRLVPHAGTRRKAFLRRESSFTPALTSSSRAGPGRSAPRSPLPAPRSPLPAPAERAVFGAPCKEATNSALPGRAGGGGFAPS